MAANKIQVGYIEAQDGAQFQVDAGTASAPGLCFDDSAATGLYSPGTGQIAWSTSGKQTALRILADGKVGVDCTPTVALEVNGTIKASAIDAPIEGTLDDWIVHAGDSDTKIGFSANDTFQVHTGGSARLEVTNSTTSIHEATDKVIRFFGSIGEIGSVTGFQATNTANSALTSFGIRATDIRFATGSAERLRITAAGNVAIGTITASPANLTVYGDGTNDNKPATIYQNALSGGGSANGFYVGINHNETVGYVWNYENQPLVFATDNKERLRITSDGVLQTLGTTKIKPHTIGIGTTATTNTGVGTAYGEMMYNTTDDKLQIYTKSNKWYNVHNWTDSIEGYYKSTTAASADGLNHYWPGNSSTSIISGLVPNNTSNSPVTNLTVDSYHGTYPYFNFYSGNDELGWRFTKGGTKWGNGPFTIAFWVRPQASTLESESTFVQLGSHSGLRSLYTVSTDASRQLKAITIGDDTGVHSSATLSTGWQHVVVTYETNRNTKYYINGSNVRTFAHSNNLDVGTSSQYIYIGYGHWNSSSSNKASMSQMSDIGIWDSDALTATEVLNLYKAKRIISGY